MESNPRDYGEQCRFDAFCKKVLRNEARAYLRNMKRQREREAFFSDLSQAELDKLCVVDRYPSDSIVFSSHGYDLHIDNELVDEAFSTLPQMEQSILILHCTLDLADGEIGNLVGMSRSAVQRHRTRALQELREALSALMPKEAAVSEIQNGTEKRPLECRAYTVNDIAQILGVSQARAYRLVQEDLFKSVRIGNAIRISKRSFDHWLESLDL